ncbi:3-keto-disaccharide hydrolase [Pontiella agarivorans]|uniref:DUF1080 domain-containing protein n=1 Tax=Pontiella agarivorans TaxID=3038953 RepID=A0ABU5MW58_9BACT|nr:DUF1080 domain-containing protein [Pontiella agarivorans]MDZ8118448.1 DUF1080 domain-containing protein [Pontiella agarivorans]
MKIMMIMGGLMACTAFAGDGFKPIFDGKSLNGWHILQKPEGDKYYATEKNFYAKDGAIHCFQTPEKKGGLLLSDGKYGDFILEMEIKSDWGCDSGIFLRCTEDGRGIQVLNDYLKEGNVGFLFGQGTGGYISRPIRFTERPGEVYDVYDGVEIDRLKYGIDAKGWNALWKPGEWNTIRIQCVGSEPMITTWVNGEKIMEMDGSVYAGRSLKEENKQNWAAKPAWDSKSVQHITGGKGSIAVQIHPGYRWKPGGAAMYRNIRIKEL